MSPDKVEESIVKLMKDVDDIKILKTYIKNKSQNKWESEQNQIIVCALSLIIELITLLAKQNDRIQSMQSSISQLIVRVNDLECLYHQENGKIQMETDHV